MEKALIVARKEIAENLKSIRYWAIIGLFVLLYIASTYAIGFAVRGFRGLAIGGRARTVLQLSNQVVNALTYIAPLLGIALGFGAIAAEREKGTIRLVLARPIYRDDLINGKLIAAVALIVLAIALSTALAVPLAVAMQNVNVTSEDFTRLALLVLPATLLALAFYALSLFASVYAGRSSHALVVSLVLWIFFTFILPIIAAFIAFQILGPPPAIPFNATRPFGQGLPRQLQEYFTRYNQVVSSIQLVSPTARFSSLASALFALRPQSDVYEELATALARRWIDVAVLATYIAVFLIASYIVFLRRQETR
jgi:ABC-2 type transport system permease protein